MTLPKKRKRMDEAQNHGQQTTESRASANEKAARTRPPVEGSPDGSTTMQMQKAFEIIDRIEYVNPTPDHLRTGELRSSSPDMAGSSETINPEATRLRISFKAPPAHTRGGNQETQEPSMLLINIHLKIPSFLWKVPFIRGAARNLIRKLARE